MPCTRSMRSKPSSTKEKEAAEMPPPDAAALPPKPKGRSTRTTRKKPTKYVEEVQDEVGEEEESVSPTPSTKPKKSRARTKKNEAKPEPVVEPKATTSTAPMTRPSRAERQAAKESKAAAASKSVDEKPVRPKATSKSKSAKVKSDAEAQLDEPKEPKAAKTTAKKKPTRSKAKATKRKNVKVIMMTESESSNTDETEDIFVPIEPKKPKLTKQQIKNCFLVPLKTVFQSMDASFETRYVGKSIKEQKRCFEALLQNKPNEMLPPLPPTAKTKGRKKRARSPEKPPAPPTEMPNCFDFSQNKEEGPAKKKILLGVPPIPEVETEGEAAATESPITPEDPNSTYVLPSAVEKKPTTAINLDVTVCLKKKDESPEKMIELLSEKTVAPAKLPSKVKEKKVAKDLSETYVKEPAREKPSSKIKNKANPPTEESEKVLSPVEKKNELSNDSGKGSTSSASSSVTVKEKSTNSSYPTPETPIPVVAKMVSKKGSPQETVSTPHVLVSKTPEVEQNSTPTNNNPNATFILPAKLLKPTDSLMNVTLCLKKLEDSPGELFDTPPPQEKAPVLSNASATASLQPPTADVLISQDRTFVKEPDLEAVEEEDESLNTCSSKSEKVRPPVLKPNEPIIIKESKKGVSSSSSSSSSSMKSASSNPCLSSKKLFPSTEHKNGPIHGSSGKIDAMKSKALEEAEKRKQEIIRQRQENSKKKMEEWKKKTEKKRLEEEAKKQNIIQSSNLLKKPTFVLPKNPPVAGTGFLKPKPKLNFGPASAKPQLQGIPQASMKPAGLTKPVPQEPDTDMDDSFKSATSLLDCTTDGNLSSYDITIYEDLDDDLKHRENKTVPKWASNKEALHTALFSMVLLPDFDPTLRDSFPRSDKSYKLFPISNRNFPH